MNEKLQALKALRAIAAGIVEVVASEGHTGAPSGVIYAAMSVHGCTLQQFEGIMGGLVAAGFLRRDGVIYFATGREIVTQNEPVKAGLPNVLEIASERINPQTGRSIIVCKL